MPRTWPHRLVLSLLIVSSCTAEAYAQTTPANGDVMAEVSYSLPPFAELPAAAQREVARHTAPEAYEAVRQDPGFTLRKVRYLSDGLKVTAYVASTSAGAARRPAIVFNRGSWVAGDQAPALAPLLHRLAGAGFVVVAPQYRGSDGGEGTDEMGGADVADVLNAVTLARGLPSVDPDNVFMYGESRGGMMTYQAIRDGVAIRAAATVGAFTDFEATVAGDERSRAAAPQIWPDFATRRAELAERRSALRWADKITVPVLILHGGDDRQISPRQSLDLAARLQDLGRHYEIHVVEGAGHSLDGRAAERDRWVVEWFRRFVAGGGG